MSNTKAKANSLFDESEKYTRLGWFTVPITDKEPPKGCTWIDKRGTVADVVYRQKYFCNNDDVKRLAILLDSIKLGFALDVDGAKGMLIFKRKILQNCSPSLRDRINTTTHTKTANAGYHWLLEIQRKDFPKGMPQRTYWTDTQNEHGEIKLIGTNQYLIERGIGYEPVRSIESLITPPKDEVNELLSVLDRFGKEINVIQSISNSLIKYYTRGNRQNIALRVAGYLHKHYIPVLLCCDLIEHLIEITNDEEPVKRKRAILDTYLKDASTDQVSGREKLLEVVNGDGSIIVTINEEFGKLGYHFSGNDYDSDVKHEPEQQSRNEIKRYEYAQKYSNDRLLAEAIIIEGKPCFAVVSSEDGQITLKEEIPLNDSKKTILRAPDISSYINKPYSFASKSEFEDYIEKAGNETLDSLYRKVKPIWAKYVDADDFHISLCAADTIFTHFQDKIGMTHYLFYWR